MITLAIQRTSEPTVIEMTREQLSKELSQVHGSELLIVDSWGEGIAKCRTEFLCMVEDDCLVNSGYFSSLIGLFKKNPYYRQLGMMGSSVGVKTWADKIYGYQVGNNYKDGVTPLKVSTSTSPYKVQIVFVPGALIRMSMLKRIMKDVNIDKFSKDLVYFSTMLSLEFWRHDGHVSVNPNTTYVTTEDYVGEKALFDPRAGDLISKFAKEIV